MIIHWNGDFYSIFLHCSRKIFYTARIQYLYLDRCVICGRFGAGVSEEAHMLRRVDTRKVTSTSKPFRNRVSSRFAGEDVQASFGKDEICL